ncbi:hypothetical protein PG996_001517 [Apiospora saccharicola]|uniref:Uncharacterized protein n=1 Tax=Apiospora saccharicola TaxID=335842 RepID=A0ABR1WGU8_9PEZI
MPGTKIFHRLPQVAPLEDYANNVTKVCNKVAAFQKAMVLLPIVLSTTVSYILLANSRCSFGYMFAANSRANLELPDAPLTTPPSDILRPHRLLKRTCDLAYQLVVTAALSLSPLSGYTSSPDSLSSLGGSAYSSLRPDSSRRTVFIKVPAWSNATRDLWEHNWYNYAEPQSGGEYATLQTNLGTFSYAVHTTRFGYFINDGSAASSLDGQPPYFAKADNTNYTYNGRSFGAGSSVGLNDSSITMAQHILSYSYNETAYHVEYQCTYDGPIVLLLEVIQTGNFFSTDIFVAAATMSLEKFILNARGYPQLQNVTCTADIKPALFNVSVDVGLKQITATPLAKDQVYNVEPTNRIAGKCTDSMASSAMISTTTFTSILGDMLANTIYRVQQQRTEETAEQKNLRAIAETSNAVFDQAFVGDASAQLILAQEHTNQTAAVVVRALVVGNPIYVYLVVAMNTLVLVGSVMEAIRTRFWRGLTSLDVTHAKNVILSSSAGGTGVYQHAKETYEATHGANWDGEAEGTGVGKVKVMITHAEDIPIISLAR